MHFCTLAPNHGEQKLEVKAVRDKGQRNRKGLVYVLVIDSRIFKIGHTINTFESRLRSYNTGRVSYRSRGTNSGANFFVLQSILGIGKNVAVHCFYPDQKKWNLLGETGHEAFPSSKTAERIILGRFRKKYGSLPIGCTQS